MSDLITDVPLKVSVEVGSVRVLVRDILEWSEGTTLKLTQCTGDSLAVKVNDRLVAKGELVLVNDRLGVRLTEIISAIESDEA